MAEEFSSILSGHLANRNAAAEMAESNPMQYRGLFSQKSADRVTDLVNDAVEKGGKVIIGKGEANKNVVQPVVIDNVNEKMKIYTEEIFGPALIFFRFKDTQQAIDVANAGSYGLAASVYGVSRA